MFTFFWARATMCAVAAPQDKTVTLPVTIFEGMVDSALTKMVRPPTKKMLGTMLRKSAPISTVPEAVVPSLSEERGLPAELPAKEKDKVVERTEGGGLKPTSEKQSAHVTAIKLQDPAHVKAFLRLHERAPGRGLGASKLILSQSKERRGKVGTKVAMGAGPLHISLRVPQGKAARKQLSSVTVKMNVVTMDENATVTMGATTYPEKMQQKLRAEIFESYLEMGRARMKICPELFETVRARLSSKVLCGKYAKEAEPLPPPPPPSRKGGGRKRGGAKAAEPAPKRRKPAAKTLYDLAAIREESGRWGGYSRWFLVEWDHSGYEPSWEAWRSPGCGEPGTPVLQWLPLPKVRSTMAFREWEAAKAEPATAPP